MHFITRQPYSLAPALLLALSLAVPANAGSSSGHTTSVDAPGVRIENFGRVDGTYYRGAQPKDNDYADLSALGIKSIINLTSDDADSGEKTMASRAGLKYFQIPMTTHVPPTPAQLVEFLKIVNDPSNQPVYVHCVGGRHRTGVMTAVYRIAHYGWTADQAFTEMKLYKFGSDFLHAEFKQFVYAYHPLAVAADSADRRPGD